MDLNLVWQRESVVGEGPVWWKDTLYWVDIIPGHVLALNPETGHQREWRIGEQVGTVVPCRGGDLLLACETGFKRLDLGTGKVIPLNSPPLATMQGRFNDGKCDPAGRFFAGTMSDTGRGSLFRLDPDGSWSTVHQGVSCSNGLCWQGERFYYIDSPTRKVDIFDYQPQTGAISNPRPAFTTAPLSGIPDGMTIDKTGNLWIAFWEGACVRCFHPATGELLEEIPIPALKVTACWFGGPLLDTLFITTASLGLSPEERAQFPLSGSVFSCKPGVRGLPTTPFPR